MERAQGPRCGKTGCKGNTEQRHRNEMDNKTSETYEGATNLRNMELLYAKRTIENKDVLISMLQEQLKKIEDRYRRNLNETERMRYKYCIVTDRLDQIRSQKKAGSKCGNTEQEIEQWRENCEKCLKAKQQESFVPELKEKIASFEKIIHEHYSTLIGLVEKISSGDTKYNECPNEYPPPLVNMLLQQQLQMLSYENGMLRQELDIVRRSPKPVEVVYANRKLMSEASDGQIFQPAQPNKMESEGAFSGYGAKPRCKSPNCTADPDEIGDSEEISKESSIQVSTFSVTDNRSDSDHEISRKSTSSESEQKRNFSRKVSLKRDQRGALQNDSFSCCSSSTIQTSVVVQKHRTKYVDESTQYEKVVVIRDSEKVENKWKLSEQCKSKIYTNESTQYEEVVQKNQSHDDGGKHGEVTTNTSKFVDESTSTEQNEQHNSPIQQNLPVEDESKDSNGSNTKSINCDCFESIECDCKEDSEISVEGDANKQETESVSEPMPNEEETPQKGQMSKAEHRKRSSVKSETRSMQGEKAVIQSNLPVTNERKVSKSSGVHSMDSNYKEIPKRNRSDQSKVSCVKSKIGSMQSGQAVNPNNLPVEDEQKNRKRVNTNSTVRCCEENARVSTGGEANVSKRQDAETGVALNHIITNLSDLRGELDRFKELVERIEDRSAYCVTEVAKFREEWGNTTNRSMDNDEAENEESSTASCNIHKSAMAKDSSSHSQATEAMVDDLEAKKMKNKGRKTKSVSLTLESESDVKETETRKRALSYDVWMVQTSTPLWPCDVFGQPSTAKKPEEDEITQ